MRFAVDKGKYQQKHCKIDANGKVKDHDDWRKVFDGSKQMRVDAGLEDRAVGYNLGDNHDVTIVYAVADKKKQMLIIVRLN